MSRLLKLLFVSFLYAGMGVALAASARVTAAETPPMQPASQPAAPRTVDHSAFDALLKKHVVNGRVDYAGFRRDAAALDAYLLSLADVNPVILPREEQLALYINAYNAGAIRGILDGRSTQGRVRRMMFFGRDRYRIGGEYLSLDAIEHEKLRKLFDEPRIHFAIVCASRSCPPLAAKAFTGDTLDAMLDERGRAFLQSSSRNRLDREKNILYLSEIFKWFAADFLQHAPSIEAFVAPYMSPEDQKYLKTHSPAVVYLPYDWSLNDNHPG